MRPKFPYIFFTALILLACISILALRSGIFHNRETIKVGILHSFTGTMAFSEKPVADAELMAIDEINKSGGLLGMQIVPVIADGQSDPDIFAAEAERLISKEKVKAIFGCWTSASRKAVKPVVEAHDSLLFYPVQYEGLEESPNIIYLGGVPNQQVIPAVRWAEKNLGKRFFLVGSDSVFSRVTNKIARDVLSLTGGEVAGEEYAPLGGQDFTGIVKKISAAKPDVIVNVLDGDSNIGFFYALYMSGYSYPKTGIMSLRITANGIQQIQEYVQSKTSAAEASRFFNSYLKGSYVCWNYFESIDTPINEKFTEEFTGKFRKKFGEDYQTTDPMESAYFAVKLWALTVEDTKEFNRRAIQNHLYNVSIAAPDGVLTISDNNHAEETVRIGKLNDQGFFDVVWASDAPVAPEPFPSFRSRSYWKNYLNGLYDGWGGHWAAPGGVK